MSRLLGIGGPAALVLAGIVLAVAGAHVVAFAVAALGLVGLTSWAFFEVGLSEDRDRERESRERERAERSRHRRLRLPPRR
jgi:hypothetical protein